MPTAFAGFQRQSGGKTVPLGPVPFAPLPGVISPLEAFGVQGFAET